MHHLSGTRRNKKSYSDALSRLYEHDTRTLLACRSCGFRTFVQGSPWGCCGPEITGVSEVENGEHSRSYTSYIYEPTRAVCEVRWCCTAAVLRGCFRSSKEVWVGIVQVVFRMVRPHNTHTRMHTHRAPFVAVTKRRPRSMAAVVPCIAPQRQKLSFRWYTGTQQQTA